MIFRSFTVTIISVFTFLCLLSLLTWILSPDEFGWGNFAQILFFGAAMFIPLVFGILILLNLVVGSRIKSTSNNKPNSIYFLWAFLFAVLPVLGFVIYDYVNRGRSFEEQTFFGITSEYSISFVLALIAILLNRKIVWRNFRNPEEHSQTR